MGVLVVLQSALDGGPAGRFSLRKDIGVIRLRANETWSALEELLLLVRSLG